MVLAITAVRSNVLKNLWKRETLPRFLKFWNWEFTKLTKLSGVQFALKSYAWFQNRTGAQSKFDLKLQVWFQFKIVPHYVQSPLFYFHFEIAKFYSSNTGWFSLYKNFADSLLSSFLKESKVVFHFPAIWLIALFKSHLFIDMTWIVIWNFQWIKSQTKWHQVFWLRLQGNTSFSPSPLHSDCTMSFFLLRFHLMLGTQGEGEGEGEGEGLNKSML